MPHITANIPMNLDAQQEQTLVSRLGELITLIPGKTEKSLMVTVNSGKPLYQGGKAQEKACYMEVKLFKDCPRENKEQFALQAIKMLEADFGVLKDHIYINFHEIFDWAAVGRML